MGKTMEKTEKEQGSACTNHSALLRHNALWFEDARALANQIVCYITLIL
jgi:hypothetical protein